MSLIQPHVLSTRRPPGDLSERLSPPAGLVTGPDRRHQLLQEHVWATAAAVPIWVSGHVWNRRGRLLPLAAKRPPPPVW